MSVIVGRFRPPPVRVSITDGKTQVQFDTPSDFADWLSEVTAGAGMDLSQFSWTVQEISGGH